MSNLRMKKSELTEGRGAKKHIGRDNFADPEDKDTAAAAAVYLRFRMSQTAKIRNEQDKRSGASGSEKQWRAQPMLNGELPYCPQDHNKKECECYIDRKA